MKNKPGKLISCILIISLTAMAAGPMAEWAIPAYGEGYAKTVSATTVSQLQQQINDHQNQIDSLNQQIDDWTAEQELLEEQISDLNAEIVNTMTSIGLKEDEIAEKEVELEDKQDEIDVTQQEYEAAKAREEKQHEDMIGRIRLMYENGESTYLSLILEGNGLGDILNRMDLVEQVYEYDRTKLEEYEATRQSVHDLWDRLELEKTQLEDDKGMLEADRADLEEQKGRLAAMLEKKKQESANYEADIKKAQQDAAVAKALMQQEQQRLKQLQAAQQNTGNSAALLGNYSTTNYTAVIDNASGSELGKNIAKYACQFIGNPYVLGGTSLTNGADCSGFTYRVYSDFNYRIPRTSYEQRNAGTQVSYDEAQPGDLICYDGHVALYIGGGMIVHASTAKTGIKVGNANYRPILSVRRII